MSLTPDSVEKTSVKTLLRTADQFQLWKARCSAACWSIAKLNIFDVTDGDCSEAKNHEWVAKSWLLITQALHDELFMKVSHVPHGQIQSLMSEIRSALLVSGTEDIQPLRLELYGATMANTGSDLQSFISYLIIRRDKLAFLQVEVTDEELIAVMLKGLHPIFQPLQIYFAIPGSLPDTFQKLIDIVRKFSSNPTVQAELLKLKTSGLSQNIFASSSREVKEKPLCIKFAKFGVCSYGDRCKFAHGDAADQKQQPSDKITISSRCAYCRNKGHTVEVCRKKASAERAQRPAIPLALVAEASLEATSNASPNLDSFAFTFSSCEITHEADALDASSSSSAPDNKPTSLAFPVLTEPNGWIMDSGATACATFTAEDCVDVRPCNIRVTAAGCSFLVTQTGTAVVRTTAPDGSMRVLTIKGCLISTKFPYRLLAVQAFTNKNHSITMVGSTMSIRNPKGELVCTALKRPETNLYTLLVHQLSKNTDDAARNISLLAKSYSNTVGGADESLLWKLHLRHGHRNFRDLCRQYGISMPSVTPACTSCVMGKSHTHPHSTDGFARATRRAEGFHSDFRGPFAAATPSGCTFLLTIIDDYSRLIYGFLVKSQSEWLEIWTRFVTRIEAEIGRPNCISWLLSDNGLVYKSTAMNAFCASKGIQQRYSAPYAQWMDHTAERNMRTIGEMSITTMIHANLPKRCWGWAVLLAIEVINRTAESAESNTKAGCPTSFSRLERWYGNNMPGQTKALYPFGCLAFKHVAPQVRSKLDAHATPAVYLGIDPASRSYLLGSLYDLQTFAAVEVTFLENVFPFRKFKASDSPASLLWGTDSTLQLGDPRLGMFGTSSDETTRALDRSTLKSIGAIPEFYPKTQEVERTGLSTAPATKDTGTLPKLERRIPDIPEDNDNATELRRSTRERIVPVQTNQKYRLPDSALICDSEIDSPTLVDGEEPQSTAAILAMITEASLQSITPNNAYEAINSPLKSRWIAAMNREKSCHIKNGTFSTSNEEPPACTKTIPADWVFKIKHRGGPIDVNKLEDKQFKARVVIRGQFMKEGLNFNDTFAPVAKPTTLRAVLAQSAKFSLKIKCGDIETAFLTATMDCEVWVKMPPFWGVDTVSVSGGNTQVRPKLLLKGVPGIPQGSRLFYETFAEHLSSLGFKPAHADKCLFFNSSIKEKHAVLIWVDDFVFVYQNEATFNKFLDDLRKKFTITCVGTLNTFLGMEIVYYPDKKKMWISQKNSINVLLERAKMNDCNPSQSPCQAGFTFTKEDCPGDPNNPTSTEYRSLIALANFISCWTRPDITFTVNKLCKYMSNPGPKHWAALKQLLRYLAGTRDVGLLYDFTGDHKHQALHGFTDSSFADCVDTGRSTLAYVFFFGPAIISWYSKLNSYVTTCTNHSEYSALSLGSKEAEWLVTLYQQLDEEQKHTPVPLYVDNSGIIAMVFNPVDHKSNKHVKIGCHYTRELVQQKCIAPVRVPSDENIADLFTKPLTGTIFNKFSSQITARIPDSTNVFMFKIDQVSEQEQEEHKSNFHIAWPFISLLQVQLGATSHQIVEKDELFASGRKKLEITFYNGDREISRHVGMQLTNRDGITYHVAYHLPKLPSRGNVQDAGQPRDAAPWPHSNITLGHVKPSITCNTCGAQNTQTFSMIACNCCKGRNFSWACNCSSPNVPEPKIPARAVPEPKTPVRELLKPEYSPPPATPYAAADPPDFVLDRPRRTQQHKTWTERIKYTPPLGRYTVYHKLECGNVPSAKINTIEFANAYNIKPALDCCF